MDEKLSARDVAEITDLINTQDKELAKLAIEQIIETLCNRMRKRGVVFEEHSHLIFSNDELKSLEHSFRVALRDLAIKRYNLRPAGN